MNYSLEKDDFIFGVNDQTINSNFHDTNLSSDFQGEFKTLCLGTNIIGKYIEQKNCQQNPTKKDIIKFVLNSGLTIGFKTRFKIIKFISTEDEFQTELSQFLTNNINVFQEFFDIHYNLSINDDSDE